MRLLLSCVAIIAGLVSNAQASLILASPLEESGTGLGAVNTVLTLQSPANSTQEMGCVGWTGSAVATTGCGFANSAVQAQFGTPTLADAGVTNASDLRVVFNASEPGNALDIRLNQLVLTLFNPAGNAVYTQNLAAPILFPTIQKGTGKSGFVFKLDPTQSTSAQVFIDANGGVNSVRVGLGASIGTAAGGAGSATGGLETFFVASADSIGGVVADSPVPEPLTMVLIGLGLVGLVVFDRKRRAV